jgi:hypothetical protein
MNRSWRLVFQDGSRRTRRQEFEVQAGIGTWAAVGRSRDGCTQAGTRCPRGEKGW